MSNYDKVKILVVGDSGVGKTCAVHLICKNDPLLKPSWTVGVTLEVKLHEFKAGTPQQRSYLVELWDVGGSSAHRNARSVFYNGVNGIILVHDLTNRKSEANLHKWLAEIFNRGENSDSYLDDFDTEQLLGGSHPPIFVIGTKLDGYSGHRNDGDLPSRVNTPRNSDISQECGADEIFINCMDPKSLGPGTTAAVKLSKYFDKVIDRRYYRESPPGLYDRRRLYGPSVRVYQ